MPKLKFTNNAVQDLSDIWSYTAETWSESQADKYYKLIIFYRVLEDQSIEITRILHERMDLKKKFTP